MEDILAEAKLEVFEVFAYVDLEYYSIQDEGEVSEWDYFDITKMKEMMMMIETRPSYPSSKLTFTAANITTGIKTRFFNINVLNLNGKFDVDVFLEDSQRNFLSSFFIALNCF